MLEIKNMTVKYGDYVVVDNVSFNVNEGQWLMIVGPNGAGKSTILNAITQGIKYSGTVLINGKDVKKQKSVQRAKEIGVLAQNHFVGYEFSVEEIIRLGRYSHSHGILSRSNETDEQAVKNALKLTGLENIKNQSVLTLSGGELQRTFLAQTFAQNPKLLLLDEPTNHLDLAYQKQVFALISEWIKEPGRAVISVIHDLSLAKAFGSDALLMNKGKCIAFGKSSEVLSEKHLNSVYKIDVYEWMRKTLIQWNN